MYTASGGVVAGGGLASTGFNVLGGVVAAISLTILGFSMMKLGRRRPRSID